MNKTQRKGEGVKCFKLLMFTNVIAVRGHLLTNLTIKLSMTTEHSQDYVGNCWDLFK